MRAPITERIRELVLRRGPITADAVAQALPELAECGGEQRALLLMRLDPQLERTPTNLWAARGTILTDERKVHRAAEEAGPPGEEDPLLFERDRHGRRQYLSGSHDRLRR